MDFNQVVFDDGNEDYYKLLNCTSDSSTEQIKREYTILMLKYHPDRLKETSQVTTDLVHKLNEAYAILSDYSEKETYDKYLNSGVKLGYKNWLSLPEHKRTLHWCNRTTVKKLTFVEPTFSAQPDLLSQFRSYKI